MPHDRYFIEQDLRQEKTFSLVGQELHHLYHVMRKKEGDEIELINGKNQLGIATISKISSKEAILQLSQLQIQEKPPFSLTLAQSWLLPAKLDWVLEKGCELGVTEFILFPSEHSAKPSSRKERMQALLIASIKQCGRLDLPKISFFDDLPSFLSYPATLLFGDIRTEAPLLKTYLCSHPLKKPPLIFIGPEKGFSPKEVLFFEQNLQAQGISLHCNILRTETAALSALSLLAHHLL